MYRTTLQICAEFPQLRNDEPSIGDAGHRLRIDSLAKRSISGTHERRRASRRRLVPLITRGDAFVPSGFCEGDRHSMHGHFRRAGNAPLSLTVRIWPHIARCQVRHIADYRRRRTAPQGPGASSANTASMSRAECSTRTTSIPSLSGS